MNYICPILVPNKSITLESYKLKKIYSSLSLSSLTDTVTKELVLWAKLSHTHKHTHTRITQNTNNAIRRRHTCTCLLCIFLILLFPKALIKPFVTCNLNVNNETERLVQQLQQWKQKENYGLLSREKILHLRREGNIWNCTSFKFSL